MVDLVNVGKSTKTGHSGVGNVQYPEVSVQQESEAEGLGL